MGNEGVGKLISELIVMYIFVVNGIRIKIIFFCLFIYFFGL